VNLKPKTPPSFSLWPRAHTTTKEQAQGLRFFGSSFSIFGSHYQYFLQRVGSTFFDVGAFVVNFSIDRRG